MRKIIIVEDQEPSKATVAHWIREEVEDLTGGQYSAELLEGAIIADALPLIKESIVRIRQVGDEPMGILVDFVDETRGVVNAGAVLLNKILADRQASRLPVVIYTSRETPEFSPEDLVRIGAKAAIRRKLTGTQKGQLGRQVLDAFEILH